MSVLQAVMIGLYHYVINSKYYILTQGQFVLGRPLISGLAVGIIMGRPVEGLIIGANINLVYLGWMDVGGMRPTGNCISLGWQCNSGRGNSIGLYFGSCRKLWLYIMDVSEFAVRSENGKMCAESRLVRYEILVYCSGAAHFLSVIWTADYPGMLIWRGTGCVCFGKPACLGYKWI